jgi:TRAP-type C4-dicarboxylate transport system permease small subunit
MNQHDNRDRAHLSGAGWFALVVLLGFLAASIWYAITAWGSLADVHISTFGWFALIFGSLLTIGVGGGLMALLFYSSRNDYDR